MKAVLFEQYGDMPKIKNVADPTPENHGVVLKVMATGVCRSDWHGWVGHDPDIPLPHVPGHELAGIIEAVGKDVTKWQVGDRVTVPFVGGCGHCPECDSGNQQVCDNQFQPGFTHWGSFAEYVGIHQADLNLVRLPDSMNFVTAASLGCRFITSYRGIVEQGKVADGQWVAVHGCGGVGLSAIMIARAYGARVIAIDIDDQKLEFAKSIGAEFGINAKTTANVSEAIFEITKRGVHISMDALGNPITCENSIRSLKKRGKHIQVGLLVADQSTPPLPMDIVVANELEIIGSHGMAAHRYPEMMDMIAAGSLAPEKLIGQEISLEQSIDALINMDKFESNGVTVISEF
ncbi:zinc-dependent alcohol dehydrogenase family protein [Pseudemcibacter aquimaris]|uniref:zinc-dependent alcohol dehydrogenase family protein n=1 Tax=Pseudemcibacter aquimaris TaxID=2857064 RepID=UPI002012B28A|nr:zinc-dependent alcohol dehydrogenase family protein [Pseudemcibacter aquimaris]MCC3861548.1 zinc-dependent alcohol dehydrogenase family protein [Pseudemcibacter aquimaris]WDU58317.1 zinc-dependent alcohol dehydrogenase family protein [Pseudemcibacter aquimaris]